MSPDDFNAETARQLTQLVAEETAFHAHLQWHNLRSDAYLRGSLPFAGIAIGFSIASGYGAALPRWIDLAPYVLLLVLCAGSGFHLWAQHRHLKSHLCTHPQELVERRVLEWEHRG